MTYVTHTRLSLEGVIGRKKEGLTKVLLLGGGGLAGRERGMKSKGVLNFEGGIGRSKGETTREVLRSTYTLVRGWKERKRLELSAVKI